MFWFKHKQLSVSSSINTLLPHRRKVDLQQLAVHHVRIVGRHVPVLPVLLPRVRLSNVPVSAYVVVHCAAEGVLHVRTNIDICWVWSTWWVRSTWYVRSKYRSKRGWNLGSSKSAIFIKKQRIKNCVSIFTCWLTSIYCNCTAVNHVIFPCCSFRHTHPLRKRLGPILTCAIVLLRACHAALFRIVRRRSHVRNQLELAFQ